MKIPKKLKIGGHDYRVLYPYSFGDGNGAAGLCETMQHTLKIDDKDFYGNPIESESYVKVTLLHEILHAIDGITGHGVFDNELVCKGTSEILYQVLHDNKLVF